MMPLRAIVFAVILSTVEVISYIQGVSEKICSLREVTGDIKINNFY